MKKENIAIIGAGAAGCFAAVEVKRQMPDAEVVVFESGSRPLAKVAITGGGRCNLTNTFRRVSQQAGGLKEVYPRGDKLMRRALAAFSQKDCWDWFEREGVRLVAQDDECVFPQSQDAMQIVGTLIRLMERLGVVLRLRHRVGSIEHLEDGYRLTFASSGKEQVFAPSGTEHEEAATFRADKVIVTVGGKPSIRGFEMLAPLGLKIVPPVPSLFTFNIAGHWHTDLMGCVVENATVTLAGTKLKAAGPLLLTHWGMSGPAILRLSSYAARTLAENDYKGTLVVNWLGGLNDEEARALLQHIAAENPRKLISSTPPPGLTSRFWQSLLKRYSILPTEIGTLPPVGGSWKGASKKQFSRLVTALTADEHEITGRCAFKEEFVTCGGVDLKEINPNTMECRHHPGLFFAGEVLDLDAVTGGFNLQAAWSTAYVAAQHLAKVHAE